MKQRKENKSSAPPWEEPGEEPQRISGAEASAAAAVVAGRPHRPPGAGGRPAKNESAPGMQAETSPAGSPARQGRGRWQPSQFGYRWVVRNIGFLLFLAALAV